MCLLLRRCNPVYLNLPRDSTLVIARRYRERKIGLPPYRKIVAFSNEWKSGIWAAKEKRIVFQGF